MIEKSQLIYKPYEIPPPLFGMTHKIQLIF
jgi:hypothetical protein